MKKKKRAVTLIEVMIVIVLIGIIGGALAFNMKGSLDEGKAFKTRLNIERVKDILALEQANGELTDVVIRNTWADIVKESPLGNGEKTTEDGWNKKLLVTLENGEFIVQSKKLDAYEESKKK